MIDRIVLRTQTDNIDHIKSLLSSKTIETPQDTGAKLFDKVEGCYKSLFVRMRRTFDSRFATVTISGSLPKFFYGNNFHELKAGDFEHFVDIVVNLFGLNPSDVQLVYLEISKNITLENLPARYLPWFGQMPIYHRNPNRDTTLYYINDCFNFTMYDKQKHVKDMLGIMPHEIPAEYRGKNVLRAELKVGNYESRRFFLKHIDPNRAGRISLTDLMNPVIQKLMLEKWYSMYTGIIKVDPEMVFTTDSFEQLKSSLLIRRDRGEINKRECSQLLSGIRKCTEMSDSLRRESLVAELDSKFKIAYDELMSHVSIGSMAA